MMRVPKIDKGKYKGAKKCTIEGGQHTKLLEIIIVFLYTIYSGGERKSNSSKRVVSHRK
jgi:hypothetical protein